MSDLRILRGVPVPLGSDVFVYPVTLSELVELGEKKYSIYVSSITLNKSTIDVKKLTHEERVAHAKQSEYDFFIKMLINNKDLRDIVVESFEFFLREEVFFEEKTEQIYIVKDNNFYQIDENLFVEIRSIISKQNYLKEDESSYKPANNKANELLERMNKIKQDIQQKNGAETLKLADVISIVASYSKSLNILNVWDLTVNQLYLEYGRLVIWDTYHNDYVHLPHMDESSRKSIKHWGMSNNKLN